MKQVMVSGVCHLLTMTFRQRLFRRRDRAAILNLASVLPLDCAASCRQIQRPGDGFGNPSRAFRFKLRIAAGALLIADRVTFVMSVLSLLSLGYRWGYKYDRKRSNHNLVDR